jgi:Tat protein secretion system quality control protein TatD with DNase activity
MMYCFAVPQNPKAGISAYTGTRQLLQRKTKKGLYPSVSWISYENRNKKIDAAVPKAEALEQPL